MFMITVMTVNKEENIMERLERLEVEFDKNQMVYHFPEGLKYRIPLKC